MTDYPRLSRARRALQSLKSCTSGVAMVEFAFAAPIVLGMGLLGTETANFTITHMQMSQLAMQVADNASRVGETDVLTARKVYEHDINESLIGGEKLGDPFDIYGQGRVVISSLQQNSDGGQWIAWQRCRGAKNYVGKYGEQGKGSSGTSFAGMGEPGKLITAASNTAVIFVEVSYTYEPITPVDFFGDTEIEYTAAFNIRDSRDLTGLYNTSPAQPVSACNVFQKGRAT